MFCQSLSFVTGVTRQEVSPVCLPSSGSATWSVSSTLSPCFSFLFIECNGLTTWSLESSVNQQSARYRLYTQIRIIQGDYLQRDGQEVGKVQRTEKPQENCHLGKRQEDRGSYRTEGRRVARATVRWAEAPSQGTVSARWPPCRKAGSPFHVLHWTCCWLNPTRSQRAHPFSREGRDWRRIESKTWRREPAQLFEVLTLADSVCLALWGDNLTSFDHWHAKPGPSGQSGMGTEQHSQQGQPLSYPCTEYFQVLISCS